MKLKKSISLLLIVIFLFRNSVVLAKSENKNLNIVARSAAVIDGRTGILLYGKDENNPIPMASTTKIITSLVAIERGNLDKKVSISKRAISINGCKVGYKENEEIALKELIFGLMLRSGNDAAIAIAEGVSGSVEEFLKLMNEKARTLGLTNCNFETPNGLDSKEHFITAKELALVTREAKKIPLFNEIVSTKQISKDKYNFTRDYGNINKLLYQLNESTGVKTGYTGNAGKCLVGASTIGDNELIEVVLNCNDRYNQIVKMHNYVKDNFIFDKIYNKDDIIKEVSYGSSNYKLAVNEDIIIPKNKNKSYKVEVVVPEKIMKFKPQKGDPFGALRVYCEDEELISYNLYIV